MSKERTRYAIVGLGGRHYMFHEAILSTFADHAQLVALCDLNPGRLALSQRLAQVALTAPDQYAQALKGMDGQEIVAAAAGAPAVPGYSPDDFDRMIAETKPDTVIVTSKDATHDEYICRAMELGCDVITEKPMTTDADKLRRILATQQRTGRKVTVTFNYRYSPPRTQVKHLLMSGVIGEITSVDFHWLLDTHHGADYFRRWHRNKENSGGLMVHKATHHFDLVNWWLSDVPTRVYADGARFFYRPETGDRLGLTERSDRCHTCPEAERCPFALKMAEIPSLKALYLDQEGHDGYFRDRCVFSPAMDIEDNMNVVVDYAGGAKMSYSLSAFAPWEGYIISFNGTKGRLEHKMEEAAYINGDGTVPGALKSEGTWIRIYPHWDAAREVEVWQAGGGHGGADPIMLSYIFAPEEQQPDEYLRAADQRAGAWSISVGIAANYAMATGQAVQIADLVGDIARPDYPAMPAGSEPLTLPSKDGSAARVH